MAGKHTSVRYRPPDPSGTPFKVLLANSGTPQQLRLVFFERVEIGRDHMRDEYPAARILVEDRTVSSRHCVVTQSDGRCYVRDISRNGTRIDGRRLVPNIKTEIRPGQTLTVGQDSDFVLEDLKLPLPSAFDIDTTASATMRADAGPVEVTVLVGDIQSYTQLVQEAPSRALQDSVARLFDRLDRVIRRYGGMLKEYQGDAVFAYWEAEPNPDHAVDACRTALVLAELVPRLAEDTEVWDVPGFPLAMDWSIATGEVVVDSMGGENPTALSMIGEPVVLAFRLEKFADERTGPIVVSEPTWRLAKSSFRFQAMGEAQVAGFDDPQPYYSLSADID